MNVLCSKSFRFIKTSFYTPVEYEYVEKIMNQRFLSLNMISLSIQFIYLFE